MKFNYNIENLEFTAIVFLKKLFIATHASILNSDLSNKFFNLSLQIYRTFRYLIIFKIIIEASVFFFSLHTF